MHKVLTRCLSCISVWSHSFSCVTFLHILSLISSTGWTDLAHDWPTAEMTSRGDWQSLLVGLPVSYNPSEESMKNGCIYFLIPFSNFSVVYLTLALFGYFGSIIWTGRILFWSWCCREFTWWPNEFISRCCNLSVVTSASWYVLVVHDSSTCTWLWFFLAMSRCSSPCWQIFSALCTPISFKWKKNVIVNAGLLWMSTVFVKDEIEKEHELDDNAEKYLHHLFREAGGVSLLLTIANVILIIVSSMLVMRIKERLPIKKRVFWDVSDDQRLGCCPAAFKFFSL